jgi:hypothetical protein
MASAKQIAANRANAKRSTGPKTVLGKAISSRNAFVHGLACSLPLGGAALVKVQAAARAITCQSSSDAKMASAAAFVSAHFVILRIQAIRTRLMEECEVHQLEPHKLRRLASLDRYERYAQTKRRRALSNL